MYFNLRFYRKDMHFHLPFSQTCNPGTWPKLPVECWMCGIHLTTSQRRISIVSLWDCTIEKYKQHRKWQEALPKGFIRTDLISAAMTWPTSPNEPALTQTGFLNSCQGQGMVTARCSPCSFLFLLFVALKLSFQLQRISTRPILEGPLPELFLLDTQNLHCFVRLWWIFKPFFSTELQRIAIVLWGALNLKSGEMDSCSSSALSQQCSSCAITQLFWASVSPAAKGNGFTISK